MEKVFEKNKKLMPITAVVLAVLSSQLLLIPENAVTSTIPKVILATITRSVLSAVLVIITPRLYRVKIGFGKKGLVKGIFWFGLALCIACAGNLIGGYQKPEISFIQALPMIMLFLVSNMGVGLFEETVFRGLLFGVFRKYFGDNRKGIYTSVLLSALLFGCIHLENLLVYPNLVISTTAQVIYAFFAGVLFAVIYYRTENLLPCIILHGVFDFCGFFWFSFSEDIDKILESSNQTDSDILSAFIFIALFSVYLISGLWQLRGIFRKQQEAETESSGMKEYIEGLDK